MARKTIDWEAVEMQYRAGIRSLKDIGGEFGVSDAAIIKRAKRDSWVRDLRAKIQARADAKVSAAMVSESVSAEKKLTEGQVVEANANAVANIQLSQRKDITRTRNLVMAMMAELEEITENREIVGGIMDAIESGDDGAINTAAKKVLSLPGRADTLKKLSESLKTLVGLERQAFKMDEAEGSGLRGLMDILALVEDIESPLVKRG